MIQAGFEIVHAKDYEVIPSLAVGWGDCRQKRLIFSNKTEAENCCMHIVKYHPEFDIEILELWWSQ